MRGYVMQGGPPPCLQAYSSGAPFGVAYIRRLRQRQSHNFRQRRASNRDAGKSATSAKEAGTGGDDNGSQQNCKAQRNNGNGKGKNMSHKWADTSVDEEEVGTQQDSPWWAEVADGLSGNGGGNGSRKRASSNGSIAKQARLSPLDL